MMALHLLPLALLALCGLAALLGSRLPRFSHFAGAGGAAAASLVGLAVTIVGLLRGGEQGMSIPWNTVVGASFSVGFDALSGFFLLAIYFLSAACALFGAGYLGLRAGGAPRAGHTRPAASLPRPARAARAATGSSTACSWPAWRW